MNICRVASMFYTSTDYYHWHWPLLASCCPMSEGWLEKLLQHKICKDGRVQRLTHLALHTHTLSEVNWRSNISRKGNHNSWVCFHWFSKSLFSFIKSAFNSLCNQVTSLATENINSAFWNRLMTFRKIILCQ